MAAEKLLKCDYSWRDFVVVNCLLQPGRDNEENSLRLHRPQILGCHAIIQATRHSERTQAMTYHFFRRNAG